MDFRVAHVFSGIDRAAYEKLYFDESFNVALCRSVKLDRTLVSFDDQDGVLKRRVRVRANRQLPRPVAKILGAEYIEYTEHLEYRWGSFRGTWRTISAVLPDKVETQGLFRFEDSVAGVQRIVEGTVRVKIFGVGGLVEKGVVEDVRTSYDNAARFTREWIAGHKPSA